MLCTHHQQQLHNCSAVNRHYTRLISLPATVSNSRAYRVARPRCEVVPASAAAAGIALAFLPWSGCSQGGFYATGVEGTHGKDCQAIYQPAAAAEARFAARLQQQQQQQQQGQGQAADAQQLTALVVNQALETAASSSRSSSTTSSPGSSGSDSQQQQQPQLSQHEPQQLTATEQLRQVPEAAKDLVRDIMHEDNRLRTKQLVDDAWQSLE